MRSRLTSSLLSLLVLLAVPASAQTKYGAGVTLEEATPFSRLSGQPTALEGQTVRVDGVVSSVCSTPGCAWIGFSGGNGSDYGNSVMVRVDPAKIAFPKTVMGRRISVEGVVTSVARDPDPEVKAVAAEFGAENLGGAPPFWELKATGAVVQ